MNPKQHAQKLNPLTAFFNTIGRINKVTTAVNGSPMVKSITVIDIDIERNLDGIKVTLFLSGGRGLPYRTHMINHADFEKWADENGLMDVDDTEGYVDHEGNYCERGGRYQVSYLEFFSEYMTKEDAIGFLIEKNIIPNTYLYAKGAIS